MATSLTIGLVTSAVAALIMMLATTPIAYGQTTTLRVCNEVPEEDSKSYNISVTGNNPSAPFFELMGNGDCTDVIIGPGDYTVTEIESFSVSGDCRASDVNKATGQITTGERQICTLHKPPYFISTTN